MYINIKVDPQFAVRLQKLIVDGGPKLAKLNGFHEDQLSLTDFINNFIDSDVVADATIDPNANVKHKDVRSLQTEMHKPSSKLLAFNKIFYELRKKHGIKMAEKWLEEEYNGKFYLHDAASATYFPYCYAYDVQRLAEEGLFFVGDNYNHEPPQHLGTFDDFLGEFVSWTSNRTSGACGLPNALLYMYYFWRKDVNNGYYLKDPDTYRRQEMQKIIYKLNQAWIRIDQSAFTNFTIFDRCYYVELFGGKKFPDGSYMIDAMEDFMEFQKVFMEVLSDIRAKCFMTYPVMSYSLLFQNHKFVDEEFAKWCCKHNMRWGDSNFATFRDVTSLSNCCRLLSNIKQLGYFNSVGGTALSVGSIKVNTINLARISYEAYDETHDNKSAMKLYIDKLKDAVRTDLICLDTIRHIIHRNVEKKLLTNYGEGLINMENQYNTIGIIGVYEVLEKFDLIRVDEFDYHYYTDEGLEFAKLILSTIHSTIDEWKKENNITYNVNIEQIPAERAASVLQEKDEHFFPNEKYTLPLYGNQWIPLGIKCTIQEKIRVTAILDEACSGGAIAHFNIENRFTSFDDAWNMLNYIADSGCQYFAFNYKISICKHNHSFFGDICPYCGEKRMTYGMRVVGFLTPMNVWSKERRAEGTLRTFFRNRLDPILN